MTLQPCQGGCLASGRRLNRRGLAAALLGAVLVVPCAGSPNTFGADKEIRALWVTRWDYRSPSDVRAIVRNAAFVGFNRLYFQVRGEGTCFFKSSVEPWAWELSGDISHVGRDPGWDPLALAIEEAHRREIELHAYLNVLPGWKQEEPPPKKSGQLFVAHPDWFMADESGRRMTPSRHDFYAFLNPARREVRTYLARLFYDVASRYPELDGVHLDYLRYPGEVGDFSHDPASLAEFKEFSGGKRPRQAPEKWIQWRCSRIDLLLADISRAIRRANPRLELSAAVTADYEESVQAKGQRSLPWLAQGLVDTLVPMAYHYDERCFVGYLNTFLGRTRPARGKVIVGLWPAEKWRAQGYDDTTLGRQIALARRWRAEGISLFTYSLFFPSHQPNGQARYLKTYFGR